MSAGLYQCPTCGAHLRVPPDATAVRCPQCQTVLDVDAPAAPAAPPLPFGPKGKPPRPPAPPAKGKAPPAPPAPPAGPVRAELVDEEAEEAEGRARAAARRRAAARAALREQADEEAEREAAFEYLTGVCKHGRTALAVLVYGLRAYAAAMMLAAAAAAALLFAPDVGQTAVIAAMALGLLASVTVGVGFVFAALGPEQGRFLGVAGVLTVVTHVALLAVTLAKVLAPILNYQEGRITGYADALLAFHAVGLASYVPMLAETPARLIQGYPFSYLGMAVGAVEFTRLVLICQLTQVYADAGKEPEAGHKSFASVSNFFWVIMLGAMFRMAVSFGFDWAPAGELMFVIGQVAHAIVLVLILEVGGMLVLNQSFLTDATREYVTAERYSLKGERLVQ